MITRRNVFNYLACKEADRIAWYKESISNEGPESDQWTSYVRAKQTASLYLTAIAIIKHFKIDEEAFRKSFKKRVFKHDVYKALRENPKLGAHCHRRAARKLVRRALKQVKNLPLKQYRAEVELWLAKRAKEREERLWKATTTGAAK